MKLLPCPFCGEVPRERSGWTFQTVDGVWGAICCCCRGPEIRIDGRRWPTWKVDAAAAWNRRNGIDAALEPRPGTIVRLGEAEEPPRIGGADA